MTEQSLSTPYYIVYEDRLRRNLRLINRVEREAGVNIIMAFKANALWRTFPIVRQYNRDFTASSLNELQLGIEELGGEAHSYCPAYTEETITPFLQGSTHITFNTVAQYERFRNHPLMKTVSPGLRVNPQCSVIETDIYNPALPGSRFGVTADQLGDTLPEGIEGLHFHSLCESTSHDLERVLAAFETQFADYIDKVKWVNMGGGHLLTREGYDVDHLISVLREFKKRHPGVDVILEPGSAFTWRTGDLVARVVDIVENRGIKTAIIDASFACHMPDCLEMPYQPIVTGAVTEATEGYHHRYRLGGNSCLSGDFVGDWYFKDPLKAGDIIRLEDMNHYTTVKTTMFNGIHHPSMVLCDSQGECTVLRSFDYSDYKNRMS